MGFFERIILNSTEPNMQRQSRERASHPEFFNSFFPHGNLQFSVAADGIDIP